MDINVRSNILIVNALLPHLNQGARIVLIGSASGRGGYPGQTVRILPPSRFFFSDPVADLKRERGLWWLESFLGTSRSNLE